MNEKGIISLSFNQDRSEYTKKHFTVNYCPLKVVFLDKTVITKHVCHVSACFACCTETGLRIYNVEPVSPREKFGKSISNKTKAIIILYVLHLWLKPNNLLWLKDFGGVSKCEMLNRTNLFAIIAGGKYPKYSQNTVLIYDALLQKFVMEITCASSVKSVRMRRNKLVISLLFYFLNGKFHYFITLNFVTE